MRLLQIVILIGIIGLPLKGQATSPDWTFESSDFQYTATVTGVIELDRIPVGDAEDQIAAFVDGELRGMNHFVYVESQQRYYIFLTISSNSVSGETMTFKYYQAATDQLITLYDELTFENDKVTGKVASPFVFSNINEEIPTAKAMDISVQLDAGGQVAILPADIDNGSADNSSFTLSIDKSDFSCADLGDQVVTLTVTDEQGNQDAAQASVTVADALSPEVAGQAVTRRLDINGQLSVTAEAFDAGTSDNCSFTLSLDRTDFTSADLGKQTLILTATDQSGNQDHTEVMLTILEYNYAPEVTSTAFTVNENSKNGMKVGVIKATDQDGQMVSFSLLEGNEGNAFMLDEVSGELMVSNSLWLDYESHPVFNLIVGASDGIDTTRAEITVQLNDMKENTGAEVYPNPAQSNIVVKVNKTKSEELLSVTAFATNGSQISLDQLSSGNGSALVYSVRNLVPGIYNIVVVTTVETYSTRLIKKY